MKRITKNYLAELTFVAALAVTANCAANASCGEVIKLQKFNPPEMIKIKGKIVSLDKGVLTFGQPGQTKNIAEPGSIIEGCIYNRNGEVIQNGTLIAQQYTSYEKPAFEAAKKIYESARLALNQAKIDYERNERLVRSNAVSRKIYLKSKTDFLIADSVLNKAFEDMVSAEAHYNADFIYSSFSGIVTNTYQYPDVWYDKFKDTASVLMLDPVAIKLTIPVEFSSSIDHVCRKPVIYTSSNEVIKDWITEWYNVEDGNLCIYILIANPQVSIYRTIPEEYSKLPKIGWPVKVVTFDDNVDKLGIPLDSLYASNDGKEFVWKLTPHNDGNNRMYALYKAQKVYVSSNDKVKYYSRTKVVELNNTGHLKKNDMIINGRVPENLKDGSIVLEDPYTWRYLPDDELLAQVPLIKKKEAFYVPSEALTMDEAGKWHLTLENGTAINVEPGDEFAGYTAVSGSSLTADMRIQANPDSADSIKQKMKKLITP